MAIGVKVQGVSWWLLKFRMFRGIRRDDHAAPSAGSTGSTRPATERLPWGANPMELTNRLAADRAL